MKRVTIALASGLVMAALAACHNRLPAAGHGDFVTAPMNDPQITVLARELRDWLGFQPAVVVDEEGIPLSVELPMRNLSERVYHVDYRMIFYDRQGRELEPLMSWTPLVVAGKQVVRLKGRALDTRAVNWKVEVAWSS